MNRPFQVASTLLLILLLALIPPHARSASGAFPITAACYDAGLSGEPSEAFRLVDASGPALGFTGWTVTAGEGR
jgi:hypothetical protein